MKLAVAILLFLFAFCSALIVALQKEETRQTIARALSQRGLKNAVSFESAAFTVSDKLSLKNVSVVFHAVPSFKNKIKTFVVHSYREERRIPSEITLTARGVRFKISDLVKLTAASNADLIDDFKNFDPVEGLVSKPLHAALLAGCDDVDATADAVYRYFPDGNTMLLSVDVKDACLGRFDAEVLFSGVSDERNGRFLLAFRHLLVRGEPLRDLDFFLDGLTVERLRFSFEEGRLAHGYKAFLDRLYLRFPGTESRSEITPEGVRKIATYLSFSNAHRQRNFELARTLAAFVKNPVKISVRSKNGKRVPLSKLAGTPVRRFVDLLLRLDVSVVNELPAN